MRHARVCQVFDVLGWKVESPIHAAPIATNDASSGSD
jgi:hypothetical protein